MNPWKSLRSSLALFLAVLIVSLLFPAARWVTRLMLTSFSVTVINPVTGAELYIDEYSSDSYANTTWIEQVDGYLFGRYRFQADLLTMEPVADILFDTTREGNMFLTGSGGSEALAISCQDTMANSDYQLMNVTLNDTPAVALPGLHGEFSPDDSWILIGDYVEDRTANWLAQCNGSAPVQLSKNTWLFNQFFSPDSDWLVMEDTRPKLEMIPQILLQELESGSISEIQAGLNTASAWFQMPAAPAVPISTETDAASAVVIPATTNGEDRRAINLQGDIPKGYDGIALFSILLWAGALIAIVILMLYLWRQSSVVRKQGKDKVLETPVEEKIPPTAEPASKPSHEEVEKAFQEGVEMVRAGKAGEGIAELTKVISAQPENDVAWFWLGIASARQKDYRSAERCFLQAKRHGHPEADKALVWLREQKA